LAVEELIGSSAHGTRTAPWLALWTHSHAEQLVHDQLIAKRFEAFLPLIPTWSRRGGLRHLIRKPMFPGYLFVRHALDKTSYIEIMKTNGMARILGERWDRPAIVADAEIEGVRQVLNTGLPILPHSYLREGHRVRITHGPLAGVEGVLVHHKPTKGLLVVSVDLLQRSVAVEVDGVFVAPVSNPVAAPASPLSRSRAASASRQ
jgi:transcription termination/antitermination protein NusG